MISGIQAIGVEKGDIAKAPSNSIPAAYNVTPATLPFTRKAISGVRRASAHANILCLGMSTTLGYLAGPSNSLVGARKRSFPSQLATLLASAGIPATNGHLMGCGNENATLTTNETRLTLGAGWSVGTITIGAAGLFNNSTTNAMSWTPGYSFDTVDVYYLTAAAAGNGQFTLDIDGGTASSPIDCNVAADVKKSTFTAGVAGNTLNIKRNGVGGAVFIIGVSCYTLATKSLQVINAGWSGAKASDLADSTGTYRCLNAVQKIAPSLTILDCGINDWNAATDLASFTTNIQAIITVAKLSGDVIVLGPIPSNPSGNASIATQASYLAVLKALALQNNCPFVSITERFGSYASGNALGFYGDNLHCSETGYDDIASLLRRVLTSA